MGTGADTVISSQSAPDQSAQDPAGNRVVSYSWSYSWILPQCRLRRLVGSEPGQVGICVVVSTGSGLAADSAISEGANHGPRRATVLPDSTLRNWIFL